MQLLDWSVIDQVDSSTRLRDMVENMRQAGAIVEIVGLALEYVKQRPGDPDPLDSESIELVAVQLVRDAGRLVECFGTRAVELLDAQAAPAAPAAVKPRERRAAKRKAA